MIQDRELEYFSNQNNNNKSPFTLEKTQNLFPTNTKPNTNVSCDNSRNLGTKAVRKTSHMNSHRTYTTEEDVAEMIPLTIRTKKLNLLAKKYDVFATKKG